MCIIKPRMGYYVLKLMMRNAKKITPNIIYFMMFSL